jgi:hypothetical protein
MAEDSNEGVVEIEDWNDLKVAELREELSSRGLDTTGTKPELVARLEASDLESEMGEDEPEVEELEPEPEAEDLEPEPVADAPEPPKETPKADAQGETPSEPESAESSPLTDFRAEVPMPEDVDEEDDIEESDMLDLRLQARKMAEDAGHAPIGGAFSARLVEMRGDVAVFEVPLR